ncbi:MAG TPA: hypothetical protein VFR97_11850 [Capillimicrobium sp.]|nr:hypothetical protein [Capillimicrobium sp.]
MTDRPDPLADEEARAAAAEAGAIGGRPTRDLEADVDHDEAMRPVYEAGGGEEEGFELAEAELIEHAQHGPAKPEAQVRVREEVDRETEEPDPAVYGEADEIDVTEVTRDPNADRRDDQGPDPHAAHDR